MRFKWISVVSVLAALAAGSVALATHVTQVDPATVPTGFLAAHNAVRDFPVEPVQRAVTNDGTDVLVQHVRLGANAGDRVAHASGAGHRHRRARLARLRGRVPAGHVLGRSGLPRSRLPPRCR
jgi:hypothetical protein